MCVTFYTEIQYNETTPAFIKVVFHLYVFHLSHFIKEDTGNENGLV